MEESAIQIEKQAKIFVNEAESIPKLYSQIHNPVHHQQKMYLTNNADQNVEKITMLMEDIHSRQLPRGEKVHEAVVEGFKERIRSTFNELYGDYEHNKELISHQIKNLEKNKTSHIQMSSRFEQTLREKNQYDKLKLQVDTKSKKLMKLRELLERQKNIKSQKEILSEELKKRIAELKQQQVVIQNLDFQKAILQNVRVTRKTLKETLKKRFNDMFQQFSQKSKKATKYFNDNEVKRRLVADLSKQIPQTDIGIPENFAIQLEDKLQHLYGKQAFHNIAYHQSIINEEANRQEHQRQVQEKETRKRMRQQIEREEKKELDRVETQYIKNKQLEQKFLKECGIRSLSEILDDRTGDDREALQLLKSELQQRIKSMTEQNDRIMEEIDRVLSRNTDAETNIRDIQKQYIKEHEQQKKLNYIAAKNGKFLQTLQSIIDRITQQPGPIQDMNLKLANFSSKFQKLGDMKRKSRTGQRKFFKIGIDVNKNQTQNSVLMEKEDEYLQQQLHSVRR